MYTRRVSLAALVVAIVLGQVGSATTQSPPRTHPDYRIGIDDIVGITVSGHEDLTQTVVVQADGSFIFPLIGRVVVADATVREVEETLRALLANGFIRDPQVTAVVTEYRSKTVFVLGEVENPGAHPIAQNGTVIELLARAGPTTPEAGSEIVILRPKSTADAGASVAQSPNASHPPAEVEEIRVNLADLMSGDLENNVRLAPGDTVLVPEASRVFVSGEVRNGGAFPFRPGISVRQAVSLAGGFTDYASSGRIRIIREIDGEAREFKASLDDTLMPGDTIVVKARLF